MKKYVIQDVDDKMYYADNNQWAENINDALHFATEAEAFDVAFTLKDDHDYILTVLTIIY